MDRILFHQVMNMPRTFDWIVVGSGLAGLSFALEAAQHGKVLLLTKTASSAGSTGRAQGGIASVMSPSDSLEHHIQDTLVAGAGLCRENRVRTLVELGPAAIQSLVSWGVCFSREGSDKAGPFHLALEGGHSASRILHAEDWTGREILRALLLAVQENPNIELRENYMAIDLVKNRHRKSNYAGPERCYGLYALDICSKQVEIFLARAVILCTGGVGQAYLTTTNDDVSTGDGIAMAYRAGAHIEDMEFVQFHPTSFYDPGQPTFLISEALRGFGGVLRNHEGIAFMAKVHPRADLAPRDIVARAIDAEIKRSGKSYVYLDMTAFDANQLIAEFPNIYQHCLHRGIDISKEKIPIVPAAHFLCGGIRVDESSQSNIPGLYACGEAACTGVHGANRLASNSLLEAVVYAGQALRHALIHRAAIPDPSDFLLWDSSHVEPVSELGLYSSARETIQNTLSNYVGIVRNDLRLQRARELIELIHRQTQQDYWTRTLEPSLIETRNLALSALLIVHSAIHRRESRGLHYNSDYVDMMEKPRHTVLCKQKDSLQPRVLDAD